ncbi:MAG: UDP-galactopyranose mutase [Chloroflexota bacterium]|jgi:UDP-galactopyranose mutase|nr:UDP-galactopyranose mutase [Chloroflexota bacterium]
MGYDYLVVGAGFAGAVTAERLASQRGKRVLVVDRRPHIGGNAYDELDSAGVLVHRYGPHIFHTNSARIFDYLSRFTDWRPYEHRVLAHVRGRLLPIPINRTTVNMLYGLQLADDAEVESFYASRAEPMASVRTSEDAVVNKGGRELFELFFRGYTRKHWGLEPSQLDASVSSRIPFRTDDDDRYFTDRFQAMPVDGYTRMFERMLDRPRIDVLLSTDFAAVRDAVDYDRIVYTGPIDDYFGRQFGALPYRSLEFQFATLDEPRVLPASTVNFPDESVPFTRMTEFKQLTGQQHDRTTVVIEYPRASGEPYYPIPRPENAALYERYKELADAESDTIFVGRLATYRYYNMDQVVGQALATAERVARAGEQAA